MPDTERKIRRPSLVLTGFMATGKTSVGRQVAEILGREFLDMDALIEADEGMSVREIFGTRGEAYFRQRESALCRELALVEGAVIATGGGAPIRPENRAAFAESFVVCLDASSDEIRERLGDVQGRPLLSGGSEQVAQLMTDRLPAYGAIRYHVDTNGKTIDQVAGEIVGLFIAEQSKP